MNSRSRTPLIITIVIVVVALAGIVAVVATRGGGDDDNSAATTLVPQFGTVTVTGDPLPEGQGQDDPAIGSPVPTITGTDYAGNPVTLAPGQDGPMMIVVVAHWCPHCNREIPLLVEWQQSGQVPEGLQVVGVSTAVRDDAPNYPPSSWIADTMKWTWPVIADDEEQTAALALGTTGYPYLVFVDTAGNVMARVSGELPIETVQQFADAAAQSGQDSLRHGLGG